MKGALPTSSARAASPTGLSPASGSSQSGIANASELLPCPFCGNDGTGPIEDALHVSHTQNDWHQSYDCYSVQCDKCTATMGLSESQEAAIEAWNTRAPSRTLTDPQRMIWRDDVEGICPSPDMCFEYGDHARCGPCAIKQATALGVESDHSVPNLPEVYRLRRELAAALKAKGENQ